VGTRHVLFPRSTDIWRPTPPVELRWLPVPRRRAGHARTSSQDFPAPRRSRPTVSPPPACRVRRLSPGSGCLPASLAPTVGGFRAENDGLLLFSQGRHRTFTAVDRLPRVTGLVSYPSRCLFSQADDPVPRCLPHFGPYRPTPGHRRFPGASLQKAGSFRDGRIPFSPPGCDAGRIPRPLFRPRSRDPLSTTLAHSSNVRSGTDCVRIHPGSTFGTPA